MSLLNTEPGRMAVVGGGTMGVGIAYHPQASIIVQILMQ